jgi:hypothetical protein
MPEGAPSPGKLGKAGPVRPVATAGGYALALGFFLLAGFMLGGPEILNLPDNRPVSVNRDDITDRPLRSAPRHPGTIVRGGYELSCNECHSLFSSPAQTPRRLTQHQHIELDHGMNDRCFNCHDRFNRDLLVVAGGATISFDQTPRLCATCHGPTYRDWELGIHGRTAGSWDAGSGLQTRLACTQCHDPHAPAFAPMTLLPGPNTIRMPKPKKYEDDHGDEADHGEHGKRNPLRQWKYNGHRNHDHEMESEADEGAGEHAFPSGHGPGEPH